MGSTPITSTMSAYIDKFNPYNQSMVFDAYKEYVKGLSNDDLISEFYEYSMKRGHEYYAHCIMALLHRMRYNS